MRWTLKPKPNPEIVKQLQQSLNVDEAIATLLVQRGIETFEDAKHFFRPSLEHLHDPYLMKDMDKAVIRILQAIKDGENILVYGDYDVDGTTSVALMSSYLKTKTANVATYIPDRYDEGYGVSYKGIDFADDNDFSLIVALDCGIKALDKIDYAKEKGIDFIICDHHRPGNQVPNAVAVLDPKQEDCTYPYKELCGCGVGFKLIQAIANKFDETLNDLIPYLDLVATAIGADIVPITGENRVLAYFGLQVINAQPRAGFKAIINQIKKDELTITDVVFIIAPRINAAGRMKHGQYAVDLLTENNLQTAIQYAEEIEAFNTDRREADQSITQEALELIKSENEENRLTTVVYQEHWHKGVIGIVASRLIETYYRPTLVFTKSGDKLAASARSVSGFDVYNALQGCAEHIEQFGGHKYAAGLTLKEENYEAFKQAFEDEVSKTIDKNLLTPEIKVDLAINLNQIDDKLMRIIRQFAPFGPGNMTPIFMTDNLKDTGYGKCVGEDKTHLRFTATQSGKQFVCIGFNLGEKLHLIKNKQLFSAVYSVDENHWQGNVSLQLKIRDIKG
ncbi:single-stranded-DNA-specific exonuclease [Mesoflavibacter sabulilitoris]|uniref:Single-stranded-DNA-specific exonuclease RecJ n=1 Tax=Mesoflavibacter zeaxanthinifaciens subsp. sabulilitoris TaxID=1520893 RepID=A0A2T1N6Q5_9FLAO|nr:single-stranded-DNA-specific exonuclease RecJ [Mesoflavibacter zeaxanthinifaciens]MBB3123092.1 single-stranded-DNA-specific exonuclease [Mesoflavibacter zeaxanthinifaciens subsp. sabulilitoris]PSG87262.1 single-stranded-DNA-specific exonuclease RecJ [Mesoflavibacter zeaxanthinifaciens subsp. sabulilitoris]